MGQFELSRTRVSLFEALLRARDAKGGKTPILEDHERRVLSYDMLVQAAFALGGKLESLTRPREIVGVMLPTGVGCTATFFALHAIGRVPAMLNFTAGVMNLKLACDSAFVSRILTSRKFVEVGKLEPLIAELSKVAKITYLEDIRAEIRITDKIGVAIKMLAPRVFASKPNPD